MQHYSIKTSIFPATITIAVFLILIAFRTPAQTVVEGSFLYDGIMRNYRLYIPSTYNPASKAPLLFNLHGYGSNNVEQENYGDFRPIADTAGFIIAHPNGTFDQYNNRFWNTFGGSGVDDVGFLSALIDTIGSGYTIDPDRIYSTGMSNGGFMSYHLACFLSDRITAVASVTGSMIYATINACNPIRPLPAMQIHGTADATVPYNGNYLFAPIDSVVSFWVTHNNCHPVPEIFELPDIDTTDNCTAERHLYSNGNDGSTVELFKVIGGGHSWPGALFNINITNMDFSASIEIWRFFRQYKIGEPAGDNRNKSPEYIYAEVFPNPSGGDFLVRFPEFESHSLLITTLEGEVVLLESCRCREMKVNLGKKGVFLLHTQNSKAANVIKIIVF